MRKEAGGSSPLPVEWSGEGRFVIPRGEFIPAYLKKGGACARKSKKPVISCEGVMSVPRLRGKPAGKQDRRWRWVLPRFESVEIPLAVC